MACPLEGIKILDFSIAVAAPFGGAMLADMGAEVIKIERVQGDKAAEKPQVSSRKAGAMTNIQKIQLIQQTINEQIKPALRAHGGNIELIDVEGNKVVVAFRGMCAQCKLTEFTMKDVVESKLREFVSKEIFVEEDKDSIQQPHNHIE